MNATTSYLSEVLGENPSARQALTLVPHLRGCSENLREHVFRYGRIVSLAEGGELTREGEFDQWIYFVIRGRLEVFIGQECVGSIDRALVGERCILGEPRGATLRAAAGGMTALALDMALLDALRGEAGSPADAPDAWAEFVELISMILGDVVRRIADLEFDVIDTETRNAYYTRSQQLADVVCGLKDRTYRDDPYTKLELFKYLTRTNRHLAAQCAGGNPLEFDTRKFYAFCVVHGRHDLLRGAAERIRDSAEGRSRNGDTRQGPQGGRPCFRDFSERMRLRALAALELPPESGSISPEAWRRHFRLGEGLEVSMEPVCRLLAGRQGLSDRKLVDVLLGLLEEASGYILRLNAANRQVVASLSQAPFVQYLKTIAGVPEPGVADYYHDPGGAAPAQHSSELESRLVEPYLAAVGSQAGAAGAGSGAEAQDTIDDLFG